MQRRVTFKVIGRVQGVAYRANARDAVERLGIAGFIRNLHDGAVVGEAEGDASAVDAFLAWCRKGPPGARVDELESEDTTFYGGPKRFVIKP